MISATRTFEDPILDEQLTRIMKVVDGRTGIISFINEMMRDPDDPLIFNYGTQLALTSRYHDGAGDALQNNGAAGLTRTRAMLGAIGESLERYACSFCDPDTLVFGSYNQLIKDGYNAFDPEKISLYSHRQYLQPEFPYIRFTRDIEVNWTWGELLGAVKSEPILFPAFMVYMPYNRNLKMSEPRVGPTISTGQATASSLEKATMSGLMEVIERDAYVITWQNRLQVPPIDLYSSQVIEDIYKERFRLANLDMQLHYLTLDIDIPVILCTAIDHYNPDICICIGVAAHIDPEIAALKALIETAQDRFYLKFLIRSEGPIEYIEGFKNIDTFEKRVRLYGNPKMIPALGCFRENGRNKIPLGSIANMSTGDDQKDLEYVIDLLNRQGYDIVRINLTTPDLEPFDIHVVKMFISEFQPLEGDQNLRFLGGRRLYRVPFEVGYTNRPCCEEELNPYPHPLP